MITDRQVKKLWKLSSGGLSLVKAAARCDMDEKTARKYRYRYAGKLPSELAQPHTWRTREDPFQEVWQGVCEQLAENPGLQAKTLFEWLQRQYPGRFQDGQLRTFQRGVKRWRVTQGPPKEVFFSQVHQPGRLCASDFTHMTSLAMPLGYTSLVPLSRLCHAVSTKPGVAARSVALSLFGYPRIAQMIHSIWSTGTAIGWRSQSYPGCTMTVFYLRVCV
jgi:hypothetical protein